VSPGLDPLASKKTVLDAARRAGVSRAIYASRINVFGTFYGRMSKRPIEYPSLPLNETFDPIPEGPLQPEQTLQRVHLHDFFPWADAEDIVIGIRQTLEESTLPSYGVYTIGAPGYALSGKFDGPDP
jgi:hypothetical protein